MELVTGFAGTAHIDPVDTAHVHAASFGPGAYLLDTQNKLAAELETANKLVIDKGDLMIQGHHFTVIEPEDVALQSGVSGQKRNALVCAKYNKDANTGVETGSWVVKYGDSTTGTPTDPTVTTGDILDGGALVHEEPVYRIEYDGITPSDPILLLDEFTNNASFRTSIDPESATITELKTNARMLNYGHMHIVQMYGYSLPSGNHALGTLPDGLKPIKNMSFDGALSSDTADHTGNMWITHNGEIYAHKNTSSSDTFSGQMVFFTE